MRNSVFSPDLSRRWNFYIFVFFSDGTNCTAKPEIYLAVQVVPLKDFSLQRESSFCLVDLDVRLGWSWIRGKVTVPEARVPLPYFIFRIYCSYGFWETRSTSTSRLRWSDFMYKLVFLAEYPTKVDYFIYGESTVYCIQLHILELANHKILECICSVLWQFIIWIIQRK